MNGNETLLSGSTIEYFDEGDGKLKFTIDCSLDSPMMGKTIKSLAEVARSFIISFPVKILPVGSEIEGSVKLIINDQKDYQLNIPKYVVTNDDVHGDRTSLSITGKDDGLLLDEWLAPTEALPH